MRSLPGLVTALLMALSVLSCRTPELQQPVEECTDLSWESDIEGIFSNWCTPCHGGQVVGEMRRGAPEDVVLDTAATVRPWAPRIVATALGEAPTMPPAGGTTPDERALIREWIACDMPGSDPEIEVACEAAAPVVGARSLSGQAAADAFCEQGALLQLDGDLTVSGSVQVDCLCDVTGRVLIDAGRLAGTRLRGIGGDLILTGATEGADLPELRSVGGDLRVHDAPTLEAVDFDWLRTVGGEVVVERCDALSQLRLRRLAEAGGDVRFESLPMLTGLDAVESLNDIDGDLVVRGTGVVTMNEMRGYERISGGVYVESNPNLTSVQGFWYLSHVRDAIAFRDNPALVSIAGFDLLMAPEASIHLTGNTALDFVAFPQLQALSHAGEFGPALWIEDAPLVQGLITPELTAVSTVHIEGSSLSSLSMISTLNQLGSLTIIGNDLLLSVSGPPSVAQIDALRVESNANLAGVTGFYTLSGISGDVNLGGNPLLHDLGGLEQLATVGGDFRLYGTDLLEDAADLAALRTIGGTLQLSELGGVSDLTPMFNLSSVGGDLIIEDNPALPMANASALAGEIDSIGGAISIDNNL